MAHPNLGVDWRRFRKESLRLQSLVLSLQLIPPAHRKLVAEIVMVRLFLQVENTVASIGAKILCGAAYLDNSQPARLITTSSMSASTAAMKAHGRVSPKKNLWWTKSSDIKKNLNKTLDASDPFFSTVSNHASLLTEMRYVRNHVAHGNSGTRANFRTIIRQHYGGLRRGVTPGLLLLTLAFGSPCILERYIVSSRVMIKDLVRR